MASAKGSLTYVLDTNIGSMSDVLRCSRALHYRNVQTLAELGLSANTSDTNLLARLGQLGHTVLLTRDGRMVEPQLQRQAWLDAGVILFLLGKRWGELPIRELSRRLLFLWPYLIEQAQASAPGQAWRVSPTIPPLPANSFRLVTGRHASSDQDPEQI